MVWVLVTAAAMVIPAAHAETVYGTASSFGALKSAVEDTPLEEGEDSLIVALTADIEIQGTVIVEEGRNVTITNDGTVRSLFGPPGMILPADSPVFEIKEEGMASFVGIRIEDFEANAAETLAAGILVRGTVDVIADCEFVDLRLVGGPGINEEVEGTLG